jgi:hypothetical protein
MIVFINARVLHTEICTDIIKDSNVKETIQLYKYQWHTKETRSCNAFTQERILV